MVWKKAKTYAHERWQKMLPEKEDTFLSNVLGDSPVKTENNPYAHYLARSVLLEESSPPKNYRAMTNIIVGFLVAFLIWASVTQLDERATAPGAISPINFVQPVQHPEGGIIADILVQEGDYVTAGQPLIILDDTAPLAEYESLLARSIALGVQEERLRSFALGRQPVFSDIPPRFQNFVEDQLQIYQAQVAAREAQINVINAQISEAREEIVGLQLQEETLIQELAFTQEEVNIRQQLIDQGLTTKIVYLTAQRNLSRTRGQLADVRTQQIASEASIREYSRRILELEERLRNEAFTEMGAVSSEYAQVRAQLARLRGRVTRTSVTSSVSGRVFGLVIRPIGGIISPGEVVMEVVPTDQELIAEVRISPRDIGHIKVGDAALVKIETFNYARFGGIEGIITSISASSLTDEEGNPYFAADIQLSQNYVGFDPRSNQLAPGMTLVADIKTGSKSLVAYLLRPIYATLQDSFGER